MVGAQGDQKKASDPLALELPMIMSHRVGAGDCILGPPGRAACLSILLCVFLGTGEIAELTGCFLFKHEDRSSDPQSLLKRWELRCVEESLQVRGQP